MKFTVKIDGAGALLIYKLTAAANRKLAPKLARYAKHPARDATTNVLLDAGIAVLGGAALSAAASNRSGSSGVPTEDIDPSSPDNSSDPFDL